MKLQFSQNDYWDKVADEKTFTHEINWKWISPTLNTKSNILDYGCGYGRLTNEFFSRGYKNITGVDNSSQMINRARREFPHLNFVHNSSKTIEFSDNQFDLILLFAVFTCIPFDVDQKNLVNELTRVLKPDGLLYISDFLQNTDQRNIKRYDSCDTGPYGTFQLQSGVMLRHHDINHLRKNVFVNFSILQEGTFDVTTMNGNTSKAIQMIGKNKQH